MPQDFTDGKWTQDQLMAWFHYATSHFWSNIDWVLQHYLVSLVVNELMQHT